MLSNARPKRLGTHNISEFLDTDYCANCHFPGKLSFSMIFDQILKSRDFSIIGKSVAFFQIFQVLRELCPSYISNCLCMSVYLWLLEAICWCQPHTCFTHSVILSKKINFPYFTLEARKLVRNFAHKKATNHISCTIQFKSKTWNLLFSFPIQFRVIHMTGYDWYLTNSRLIAAGNICSM